eukprot:evm.model.scf_696.3 EVM.evm.TU.scf_696.3   scf_696:32247-36513(+)
MSLAAPSKGLAPRAPGRTEAQAQAQAPVCLGRASQPGALRLGHLADAASRHRSCLSIGLTGPFQRLKDSCRATDGNGSDESATAVEGPSYDKLLLTISDANPYLSDGSRQALAMTAGLASIHKSKVTVLMVEEPGEAQTSMEARSEAVSNDLRYRGCSDFQLLCKELDTKCSVVVGEVADEIEADLVVISSDSVHKKTVDANLLAEFVPCPVLMVP